MTFWWEKYNYASRFIRLCNLAFQVDGGRGWMFSRMGWWGRYFDLTRRKWQEDGKICWIMIFMILAPHQMLFVFIKWRVIRAGKRVSHMRKREIYIAFWLWNLKEEDNFEELVADGKILLKFIVQNYCLWVWAWLSCLRIGTIGWLFRTRWWIFWFHEFSGLTCLTEEIARSD